MDPLIKSKYIIRNSFYKLLKQYFSYGFYKVRVIQKRKSVASFRHLVPSIFVLTLFFTLLLFITKNFLLPLKVLIIMYLGFGMIFGLIETFKFKSDKSYLKYLYLTFLIMTSFFTLHFSYGSGFIFGIIRFSNKWNSTKIYDDLFIRSYF